MRDHDTVYFTEQVSEMKEDILEQLVDDYLQAKGYFTRHNINFRRELTIQIS